LRREKVGFKWKKSGRQGVSSRERQGENRKKTLANRAGAEKRSKRRGRGKETEGDEKSGSWKGLEGGTQKGKRKRLTKKGLGIETHSKKSSLGKCW